MKHFIRVISMFLICSLALSVAACKGTDDKEPVESTTKTEEVTTERKWLDSLPDDLTFNGATIRLISNHFNLNSESSNLIDEAWYRKNLSVVERLNIKLSVENIQNENDIDYVYKNVQRMAMANDDWWDFINGNGIKTAPLAYDGLMINMAAESEFDYLDLTAPWWSADYIEALNIQDYVFWVSGCITTHAIDQVFAVFVNLMLAQDLIKDDTIYDIVRRGEWTIDKMREISNLAYKDDGDGIRNEADVYGMRTDDRYIDMLAICALADYTTRDADNIPEGNCNTERNVKIGEMIYDLMHSVGYCENDDFYPGNMFQSDHLLFWIDNLDVAERFGNMKSDFGIIPMPKFDEDQEFYYNTAHEGMNVCGIPTTVTSDRYEMVFAFMEAMASESYRTYRPTYLDIALKDRYSRDDDTREMLDLLHSHIYTDFAIVYGQNTGMNDIFVNGASQKRDLASIFAAKSRPFQKIISKIVNEFDDAA